MAQLHKGKSDSNAKKFCNTREIGGVSKAGLSEGRGQCKILFLNPRNKPSGD